MNGYTCKTHNTVLKRILIICLVVLIVLAIAIGVHMIFFGHPIQLPDGSISIQNTEAVEKNENSISVPGYEGIALKADSLEQEVALKNPVQNTCYFVITLYLEDGTVLWQSDYIKPGETSSPIVLNQPLEEGSYPNAVLQYSCFKMDSEKTPLNGAETKLTLRVKK
mgnify:CR=1 FL=1